MAVLGLNIYDAVFQLYREGQVSILAPAIFIVYPTPSYQQIYLLSFEK